MALITCPECGNTISNEAIICPHCGGSSGEICVVKCLACGTVYDGRIYSCPNCKHPTFFLNNDAKVMGESIKKYKSGNIRNITEITNISSEWKSVINQLMELDYKEVTKLLYVIEHIQQIKDKTDNKETVTVDWETSPANETHNKNAGSSTQESNHISKENARNKSINNNNKRNRSSLKAGETLKLGKFDGVDITWRILNKNGSNAMIITEEIINTMPFDTKLHNVTWNDSLLRKWLNDNFYNHSFTEAEKNAIRRTEVNNTCPAYDKDNVKTTENTMDKVFVLSKYEKEDSRQLNRTDFDKWQLRSVAADGMRNYFVGNRNITDKGLCTNERGVRPVMWIDLSVL